MSHTSEKTQEEYVGLLVDAIKKSNDAPARSDEIWQSQATNFVDGCIFSGASLDPQRIPNIVATLVKRAKEESQRNSEYAPPPTCQYSASTLTTDLGKRKIFENEILPEGFCYGTFVHVPSYIAFLKAMNTSFDFTETTQKIIQQPVTVWCPKEGKTTELETPRSCHISRVLSQELQSEDCTVVHQTPILPSDKLTSNQDVDIAIFCETTTTNQGQVAVVLEYKPGKIFADFEAQSACYGTDYMNISQRCMIVVQVSGKDLNHLSIRAFGIVRSISQHSQPRFHKGMLMEGESEDGLKMLISGIKGYLQSYKTVEPGMFMEHPLSNVTSLHKRSKTVVKGYDYRGRKIEEQDRRMPNIKLVQEFIDPDAENFEIANDLCIVTTKFYGRDKKWFDPIPSSMLGLLLENLQKLHGMGYVHGDIRLLNCILHTGKLVDYDFCRVAGALYPSTLRHLKLDGSDGKRAEAVGQAIENCTIGSLKMEKEHDLESMLYLLQLFRPMGNIAFESDHSLSFSTWWEGNITSRTSFVDLFDLIDTLKKFSDTHLVELSRSIEGGGVIEFPVNPQGTDSPGKK